MGRDDGEDMGMGVSNTIKNKKKRPDPKYASGSLVVIDEWFTDRRPLMAISL